MSLTIRERLALQDAVDAARDAAQRAGFDPTLTFKGSSNSNQTQAEQTNEPTVWRWKRGT